MLDFEPRAASGKLELIADFARDFTVLSAVGSKDSSVPLETLRAPRRHAEGGAAP